MAMKALRRSILSVGAALLTVGIATALCTRANAQVSTGTPYIPTAAETNIVVNYSTISADPLDVSVTVTYTFPTTGYTVDWGDVVSDGSEFIAETQVWAPTGVVAEHFTSVSHTYELGDLPVGTYTFDVNAWGEFVKGITFGVPVIDPPGN